jgi:hypothetical protein
MSIAENLRLSNPGLTDGEIKNVLSKANALFFIEMRSRELMPALGLTELSFQGECPLLGPFPKTLSL